MQLKLNGIMNTPILNMAKSLIQDLTKELSKEEIKLTNEQELKYASEEAQFLNQYMKDKDLYIVNSKPYDDRYKLKQYADNKINMYRVNEKDISGNVKIGDVLRKQDFQYIVDKKETNYIKNELEKLKVKIYNEEK